MTDGASLTVNASFVSREQVICQLPDSGIYNVSVSNDGNNFGTELTFIGYDSACYICDQSGCSQRVSFFCVYKVFFGGGCNKCSAKSSLLSMLLMTHVLILNLVDFEFSDRCLCDWGHLLWAGLQEPGESPGGLLPQQDCYQLDNAHL